MAPSDMPLVRLRPGESRRIRAGHPWAFANEVVLDGAAKSLPPGELVTLAEHDGTRLGVASLNWRSLIAARLFTRDAGVAIDAAFFTAALERALARRQRHYGAPYYRLVHAEADGLPGLVVDRFGDVVVCQINTAGMARLEGPLVAALDTALAPTAVVLRGDSPVRAHEGLESEVRVVKGAIDGPVAVEEDGVAFLADLCAGQKTGWFYDQRPARDVIAGLAAGRTVLDLYCYSGGFALRAAAAGAARVTAIDSSDVPLRLAEAAAARNAVAAVCTWHRAEVFAEMARRTTAGESYDLVIADPPAFVRSRKGLKPGLKGYRKLARAAAALVAPGGILFVASCSHLVDAPAFAAEVRRGLAAARRSGRILESGGAGPDHPEHLFLPESAYLRWQLMELD